MFTALLFTATLMSSGSKPATHSTVPSCCVGMEKFASDPQFVAAHLAPTLISFKPSSGKNVTFPDAMGRPTTGFYVAGKAGSKVGIVMVHEWWGLNDHIRQEAERLHEVTGYAFLAVDLYEGKSTTVPADAGKLMSMVEATRAKAIVKSAVNSLKNGRFGFKASKIGTIGYCFGGGWSYQTAVAGGSKVDACVMYYGMPDTSLDALNALRAPVLMIWGKEDKWINADVVSKFEAAMKGVHKPLRTIGYEADHGFANPSNPKFNAQATAAANSETLKFWRKHLG